MNIILLLIAGYFIHDKCAGLPVHLVLAVDWKWFLILLCIGCVLAVVFNYGCCISFSASVLFPIMYGISEQSLLIFLIVMSASLCIMVKHLENIRKIKDGEEMPIRKFLAVHVLGRRTA